MAEKIETPVADRVLSIVWAFEKTDSRREEIRYLAGDVQAVERERDALRQALAILADYAEIALAEHGNAASLNELTSRAKEARVVLARSEQIKRMEAERGR